MASVVSRESYFETGLDVLSDLGYGGLKLAEVCNRLGVTTGRRHHGVPGSVSGCSISEEGTRTPLENRKRISPAPVL